MPIVDTMSSPEIVSILIPLKSKYFELGQKLLTSEEIKKIEAEHASEEHRLAEIICLWQKLNTSSSAQRLSTLADAVETIGGHDNVVRELRKLDQTVPTTCSTMAIPHVLSSSKADSGVDGSPISETHHFEFVSGCGCSPSCSLYTISAGECPNPTSVNLW